ncbi:MAG: methyltransferase domain-containing protein [Rhodanobacteraceae bacterium]
MDWRIKGSLQKILGVMPGGVHLHYVLQRRFGGLAQFDREVAIKIDDWEIMVTRLRESGYAVAGRRLFEIGTGWYPTFPFACYLAGAARVTTVDLTRHIRRELVVACADRLGDAISRIAHVADVDEAGVRARHARLVAQLGRSIDLSAATDGVVVYSAPADATRTDLENDSVDCIFSNSVLEHVPPDAIEGMYREATRILAPGGIMFHSVNCGDHYAYVDSKIDGLNYLRYSDREWQHWDNAFLYQNRLRAHEFVERAEASGFDIVLNTAHATEQRLRQLAKTPVHAQFAAIPPERLCITTVDFIARKPESAA